VPFRTLPGGHPNKGAYFTRGTSRDKFARYTEEGNPYVENMERLLRKWETAKSLVPAAEIRKSRKTADVGVVYYGSTSAAMDEALAMLAAEGLEFDAMRLRAYPFGREVEEFLAGHRRILIVEQNRDAQMRTLLLIDFPSEAAKFVSILNYDGSPITARFIAREIRAKTGVARRVQEAAE
jgi:2-oxoglutarate ferredoxin oxidoreductase subunit alpha